jgi:N-acylneuraminate cytidylyltransferase
MKLLGIITARGGSKGIPRKNIKPLNGKPLIAHTIDAAKESGVFDRIIVSTEDAEIAEVARQYGAEVPFMRPAELAEDTTPTLPVLIHALDWLMEADGYQPDAVAILQPTAPLRQSRHLREAFELFESSGADSVVSLNEVPVDYNPHWQFTVEGDGRMQIFTGTPLHDMVRRRQDLKPTYTRNGAIYIFKPELLRRTPPTFYGEDSRAYIMDAKYSVNINTPEEFEQAEHLMKALP